MNFNEILEQMSREQLEQALKDRDYRNHVSEWAQDKYKVATYVSGILSGRQDALYSCLQCYSLVSEYDQHLHWHAHVKSEYEPYRVNNVCAHPVHEPNGE